MIEIHHRIEIRWQEEDGIQAIDRSMLLPRLFWPLAMYKVVLSCVKSIEKKLDMEWKRWLGVPRILTDVALHAHLSMLHFLMRSTVEKCV